MSNSAKYLIIAAMVIAGITIVACLLDFIIGLPFGGATVMDVCFLIGAGLVLFLSYDAYKDLS